ncbi:hypothetical protein BHE74_00048713 [Ensete ventricosum]|nr:hypothetical protein GW17_00046425 [Ensete ventricosum]RWW45448.1 hypothetical protein BHE74_00048713 [Ensete ventricosum]RZR82016.1 hypothetical protein BHM03_00008354 [Ensete ventricosum]
MWGWGGISGANTPRARYVHRPVPLPISFIELHRVGSDRRPCERGLIDGFGFNLTRKKISGRAPWAWRGETNGPRGHNPG